MKTHLTKKAGEKNQQKAAAHHTNQLSQRKSISLQDNRANTSIIQKMEVAQLATRNIKGVRFNGFSETLRGLLLRWAVPSGTKVTVTQTDNVGGSFNVKFTKNGPPITIAKANSWINAAKRHHKDKSSSEESGSDSDSGSDSE
jgi:hypothetical protein